MIDKSELYNNFTSTTGDEYILAPFKSSHQNRIDRFGQYSWDYGCYKIQKKYRNLSDYEMRELYGDKLNEDERLDDDYPGEREKMTVDELDAELEEYMMLRSMSKLHL